MDQRFLASRDLADSGSTLENAGAIDLVLATPGAELILGDRVSLQAKGGAWVASTGNLTQGSGGAIVLSAAPPQSALQVGSDVTLAAFGVGTSDGGSFSLSAPRLAVVAGGSGWSDTQRIDDLNGPNGVFDVGAALFSQYGFASISLNATGAIDASSKSTDVLTVVASASAPDVINATAESLQLKPGFLTKPTGGTVEDLAKVVTLPQSQRDAMQVSLSAVPTFQNDLTGSAIGDLNIEQGATIYADPGSAAGGGSISLTGWGSILINGSLHAPGGTVNVSMFSPTAASNDVNASRPLELLLGSAATIDVGGITVATPNTLGLPLGNVLAGGAVDLSAYTGGIVTLPGP